jgi:hypothetical protein
MKWLERNRMRLVLLGIMAGIVLGGGSAKADFVFSEPTDLGPPINGAYLDGHPCASADSLEFYFASNRPGGSGDLDIWLSTRQTMNDDWGEPVNLGPNINSSDMDGAPAISPDGLELYFSRGGWNNSYIFASKRPSKDAPWGSAVRLGPEFNSYSAGHPEFSADGLSLYFVSNRPGGLGRNDIWVTIRAMIGDPWSEPVNLGLNVNSSYHDYGPSISSDGRILFFDSYRSGTGMDEQWLTVRSNEDNGWGPPLILAPNINSGHQEGDAEISPDGSCLYFSFFNDSVDIYQSKILPLVDLNSDGIVDSADMCIMIEHWGTDNSMCDIGPMPWGDGVVDVEDLKVLTEHLFDDYRALAQWKLDEKAGKIAHDYVGGYNATLHGESLWQPTGGQIVGALELDGIDDYISTDFILNPYWGAFSAFAWIKGGGSGQVIITQLTGTGNIWLGIDAQSGALMTELQPPSTGWVTTNKPLVSESIITDEQWHHVGFVWDGSYRILYVDSIEVAKDTTAQNPLKPSDGGLYIGTSKTLDAGTFFSGLIDDVRIYNQALSAEEIAVLAQ